MDAYEIQKNTASGSTLHAIGNKQVQGRVPPLEPNSLLSYQHLAGHADDFPVLYQEEGMNSMPHHFASQIRGQQRCGLVGNPLPVNNSCTVGVSELNTTCHKAAKASSKKTQSHADSAAEARAWQEFCLLTMQWAGTTASMSESEPLVPHSGNSRYHAPVDADRASTSLAVVRPPPGLEEAESWLQPQSMPESVFATEYGFATNDLSVGNQTDNAVDTKTSKHEAPTSATVNLESEIGETLRGHLQELQNEDPRVVIIVRKISKLGFQSPELLKNYFEEYGDISKILVAHSYVKPSNRRVKPRVRPAGLGFIVMASQADADAVLCLGESQTIAGVPVQVQPYARPEQSS